MAQHRIVVIVVVFPMTTSKIFKVGLIIGTQRAVRIGPQVADFILDAIKTGGHAASSPSPSSDLTQKPPGIAFDLIDLAAHRLPIFVEPGIPNQITSPEGYEHEHTRIWARRIAACDAFVFVSAQRNWGTPAELKNAIDYLFNEWKGKPAMLVTYGGHGGRQCAAQLRTVLGSIRMRVVHEMVHMSFPSPDFRVKAFRGEALGLDAKSEAGPWAEHRSEIIAVWNELVSKMLAVENVLGVWA